MTEPSDTMQTAPESPESPDSAGNPDSAAPEAAPTPAAAPATGRGKLLMIVLTVVVVLAVAVTAYMKYHQITTSPDKAKVSDCLSGTTASSLQLADCSDSSAKWRVLGKATVKNKPTEDEQRVICAKWPDTQQMYAKAEDYVLCLGSK